VYKREETSTLQR